MKTKLLKKVRKRFKIMHYPKGLVYHQHLTGDSIIEGNFYCLVDKKKSKAESFFGLYKVQLLDNINSNKCNFADYYTTSDVTAINYLKTKIINRLRDEGYGTRKLDTAKKASKQIWP